jgi:predicted nucleotidyltransferase
MNSIIENKKSVINQLCKDSKVNKLYAFDSVLTETFNENSDIDLLVSFDNSIALLDYADNYFNFLFSLENLFDKQIDLVTEKSLKNPYFIE